MTSAVNHVTPAVLKNIEMLGLDCLDCDWRRDDTLRYAAHLAAEGSFVAYFTVAGQFRTTE